MKLLRPRTLDETLQLLAAGDGALRPIAGGTDLMVSWHHHDKTAWTLLDLSLLDAELRPLRLSDDALELGALTTYWDVIRSPDAARDFPLLVDAARQVGAIQIQTRGTWAGNVANASPAADGVPVMMAYDAAVRLASASGRREVPLADFYTGYRQTRRAADELIVGLRMPRRRRAFEWFHKVGARQAQAIAKVGVAMVRDPAGWRVAANSVAPFVCRCRHLEAALDSGRRFASPDDVRRVVSHDVSPIDDMRSTARYRLNVLSRLIYFRLQESSTCT